MAFFWSSLSQSFIWLLIQQERRNSRIGIIINLCIYWFLYCKDSTFFWPLFRSLIDRHSSRLFFVLRPVDRLPLSTLILWLAWKRLSGGSSFIGWLSLGHLVFWRPRFIEANRLSILLIVTLGRLDPSPLGFSLQWNQSIIIYLLFLLLFSYSKSY